MCVLVIKKSSKVNIEILIARLSISCNPSFLIFRGISIISESFSNVKFILLGSVGKSIFIPLADINIVKPKIEKEIEEIIIIIFNNARKI